MELNIATFNIQHGRIHPHYLATKEELVDPRQMAEVIREMGADICGLNEVYNQDENGLGNQAKIIGEALGMHWVFGAAIPLRSGGLYGNALVSKYPIVASRTVPIVTLPEERPEGRHYEDRVLLIATVEAEGREITVMSCHFGLNPLEAERARETVLAEAKKISGPVIFMGDLNLTPEEEDIRLLSEYFTDSHRAGEGEMLTFPSHDPRIKIDYIFARDAKILTSEVFPRVCADHLPVCAKIEF